MKRKFKSPVLLITGLIACLLCLPYLIRVSLEFMGSEVDTSFQVESLANPNNQNNRKSSYRKLMELAHLSEKGKKLELMRLEAWKENFPWKPTHDPKVVYDASQPYQFVSGVDITDFTVEQRDELRAFRKQQSNTEMAAGVNHTFLKKFFEDKTRFTPQFEMFCNILKEHGRGHNPVMVGSCFWALRQYYHAAYENEPSEYVKRGGKRVRKGLFGYVTWGERATELHESLRGWLRHWEWLNPQFGTEAGKAEANALINRLVAEVQGLENLPIDVMSYGTGMSDDSSEYQSIKNGDKEMLVPYLGWFEQSKKYDDAQTSQFEISFAQGDPSLKLVAPELFPPVDIKNGQLVDKDGDTVKWSENMEIALINKRGERVPVIVGDDGSVSLPTPEEVERMRQKGDVRPGTFKETMPIIKKIVDAIQPSLESGAENGP